MPGFLLHQGATVLCSHAGQATPVVVNPRVKAGNQPIVMQTSLYTVAGCAMPPPPTGNGPCVTAQWITAATRVQANSIPVLLQDSQSICVPTGTPLTVVLTQIRVKGT
jgi:hypothetical protein